MKDMGRQGHFETINGDNTAHTVEILNSGAGNGLHIETADNLFHSAEAALHVEQADLSLVATKGYAAHFDLQNFATTSEACVYISSASVDPASSALLVTPAGAHLTAATFEGKVEIGGELEIADAFFAPSATIVDLTVTTSISAPAKAFKIDHPLDPNKYLYHNSIESNERLNIYSGNVTTDKDGYATVTMPDYMNALNADFRYQLTVMDKSFAQAVVWEEMEGRDNSFVIKTNEANIKVSWQVTGERIDKWALENPLEIEVDKNDVN